LYKNVPMDVHQKESMKMSNELTLIVSFILGLITSFLAWLIVARVIRPKIVLSEMILFVPSIYVGTEAVSKIKIENQSRFDAFELNLKGRMFLYGLVKGYPEMPTLFVITIGNGSHPYLPNRYKGEKEKTGGRSFRLHMNKTARKNLAHYVTDLKPGQEPTIWDFLKLDTRNYIEVSVFCSHSFSASRGIRTQKYFSRNISDGYFDDHGVTVRHSPSAEYLHQEDNAELVDENDQSE
jgi:hypothetical protein